MAKYQSKILIVFFPVFMFLVFSLISQRFTANNIGIVLIQTIIPTLIGFALYQGMAGGLLDLSIGARIILASFVGAYFSKAYGIAGLILGCFVTSMIAAMASGALYVALKIPSFFLALCLILIMEPMPYMLFNKTNMSIDGSIAFLGKRPYNIIIAIAVYLIFSVISGHMKYSYHLRAIGSEEGLAKTLGVKTDRVKFESYVVSELLCGFASLLYVCYSNIITMLTAMDSITLVFKPLMGVMIAMQLVSRIDLGVGIFIGELTLTIIFNGLLSLNVPDNMQNMVLGVFMLAVIAIMGNRESLIVAINKRKIVKNVRNQEL